MVDKICDKLMERVRLKMPEVNEERAEVIRYGFELIVGEFPKIILMFIIAAIIGKLEYFVISIAIICPYRTYSGGIHLKTHTGCFITTNMLYLGNLIFSEWFRFSGEIQKWVMIAVVYIFSIIIVMLNAPADTETVPILRKKDRRNKKIAATICCTIVLVVATLIPNDVISNMCIFGVFLQTLTITRLSYKIFRVKPGYLEYKKSL